MTTFPNKSLLALLSCTIILPEASVFALISFDTHLFGSSSSSSSAGSTTVERSSRKRQQQYAFSPLFSQRTNNENDESDGEGEIVNGKKKGESLDHIRSRLEDLFHTPPNEWVSSTADNKSSFQYKEADWLEACGEECEQCDIPEEFKILPEGSTGHVDVLSLLGIHRAEPLRVKHNDWE